MTAPDATDRLAVPRGTGSTSARGAGAEGRVGERAYRLLIEHRGFVALSVAAIVVLFALTRTAWFWHDEWMFIRDRSFSEPATWFAPHAQHFVAGLAAVYTALVTVFGTGSYLPFLAVLWATHVAFAAGIYALVDRHVGRGAALAAAATMLFLGSAALNLFWAFQMGAVGSVALALWGLIVIRDRPGLAALLLTLGIATTGFALFVIPVAAIYGRSRRALVASMAPVAVYALWYLLVGRGSITEAAGAPSMASVADWLVGGLVASAATLTGLGTLGVLVLVLALPLILRSPGRVLAVVGLTALVTEYTILAVSRQGINTPGAGQYIYFGAAFLLLVLAPAWTVVPRRARPLLAVVVAFVVATNMLTMIAWSATWPAEMAATDPLCLLC